MKYGEPFTITCQMKMDSRRIPKQSLSELQFSLKNLIVISKKTKSILHSLHFFELEREVQKIEVWGIREVWEVKLEVCGVQEVAEV